jgi:hypothetical protein
MSKKNIPFLFALGCAFFFTVSTCYAFGNFGDQVNLDCAPAQPYVGDCALCHTGGFGNQTPAKDAYLGVDPNLTYPDFFCPSGPTCTDLDGDTFAIEGGACGQVDCNDNDAAVNPGAAENCTDTIDNDCDGLIDAADNNPIGCPPVCTDNDGDTYAIEGGACGPIDCNDADATTNPGAAEICDDGQDNTCNGVIDEGCVVVPTCTDSDGDTYAIEGGACGPIDCNDADATTNPGAAEICDDGQDNTCDGVIDEGCVVVPTCTDSDGDTYAIEGGPCGPVDCDDTDATVNPNAVEDCLDGIDNNCNDLVDTLDDTAANCPLACTDDDIDNYALEGGTCGPADCNDTDGSVNPGATEICDDGIDNDCDGSIDEGCDPACPDADGDGFLDAACGGADCDDTNVDINPGVAEVCGNDVDENCNGASDAVCQSCPEGGLLIIKETKYNFEKSRLEVKGKSHVNTFITLTNAQTGEVLADNVEVDGGEWKVRVKDLDPSDAPEFVEAINSDGCFTDKKVKMENRPEEDVETEDREDRDYHSEDDDDHEDDDDDDDDDDHEDD